MSKNEDKRQLNIGIDPLKTPILYADGYAIGSNQNVVTFNFLQGMPSTSQKQVISRIALTKEQAKEFLKNLNDHIEKFEM